MSNENNYAIYKYTDKTNKVAYVGQTKRGLQRDAEHKAEEDNEFYLTAEYSICAYKLTATQADAIESLIYMKLQDDGWTLYNKKFPNRKVLIENANKLENCPICKELDCTLSKEQIEGLFNNYNNYQEYCAQQRGFKNLTEYNIYIAQQNGFETLAEYQDSLYKAKGYKSRYEYNQEQLQARGFAKYSDYVNSIIQAKGYKNRAEYENSLAQKKGFKTDYALRTYKAQQKGFKNQGQYSAFRKELNKANVKYEIQEATEYAGVQVINVIIK